MATPGLSLMAILRPFSICSFPDILTIPGKSKFVITDLAFDESAETRWHKAQAPEADNIDVGPITEADLQIDLIKPLDNPF